MENNEQELIDLKAKIESLENVIKSLIVHIGCNTFNIHRIGNNVKDCFGSPIWLQVVSNECFEPSNR